MASNHEIEQLTFASGLADQSRGVMDIPVESMPAIDPDSRITLVRLASEQGLAIAAEPIETGEDAELQVGRDDFARARPDILRRGLYIDMLDPRYRDKSTQQLLWAWGKPPMDPPAVQGLDLQRTGVVVPADEFKIVAHSPTRITKFAEAQTRHANRDNLDRVAVDEGVGRSAGHAMESKIGRIGSLEEDIRAEIDLLRIPYREAASTWRAHFGPKRLGAIKKEADERIHEMIETATLNLNPGSFEIRALHRAVAARLHRGSRQEIAHAWRIYTSLAGQYATARLVKATHSRIRCQELLEEQYRPYLERAEEAGAPQIAA